LRTPVSYLLITLTHSRYVIYSHAKTIVIRIPSKVLGVKHNSLIKTK